MSTAHTNAANLHPEEIRKLTAEADLAELEVQRTRIILEEGQLRAATKAADSDRHRILHFWWEVNSASCAQTVGTLGEWSRETPGCDITVMFNSPGGAITHGLALYDFIIQLRNRGHKITTEVQGQAASMAGVLLQAGDVRRMGRTAYLLLHEASFVTFGKVGDVEDQVAYVKRLQERLLSILAERSTMTKAQIRNRWKKTDYWLDAAEALAGGFIDEIV